MTRTDVTDAERSAARRLATEAGGLHDGEAQVLATAAARSLLVLLFEQRALRRWRRMEGSCQIG